MKPALPKSARKRHTKAPSVRALLRELEDLEWNVEIALQVKESDAELAKLRRTLTQLQRKDATFAKVLGQASAQKAWQIFQKQRKPTLLDEVRFWAWSIESLVSANRERHRSSTAKQLPAKLNKETIRAAEQFLRVIPSRYPAIPREQLVIHHVEKYLADVKKLARKRIRRDPNYVGRRLVRNLAFGFLAMFGRPYKSVIAEFAELVKYEPDSRNLERAIADARKEYNDYLSETESEWHEVSVRYLSWLL